MERLQAKARARYAFAEYLGSVGMRCTPERLLILDAALDRRKDFTAVEIHELCGVSRATVFNTLPLLVKCGLLRHSPDGHYEAIRAQSRPKLHMICTNCGKEHHTSAPALAQWVESLSLKNFTPMADTVELYIHGECDKCRRKHNQPRKS